MAKKLFIILFMGVTTFLFAQTIAPKKCNTCNKPLSQCQYKGKHPKQTPKPQQKPTQMQTPNPVQLSKPASGYENGYEWVDLGLSVKWATKNVGASSPSDYGGYYAWGETRTKSSYEWSNCFDCLDDTGDSWEMYKIGGTTRITPNSGHDTARENWGGKWRMPTDAKNNELLYKCTWTWTTQNGHEGYKVTGKNGNSIFFPAAGYHNGTDTFNMGHTGDYWSNMLSSSDSNGARCLCFNIGGHFMLYGSRRYGQSVRPVLDLN